MIKKALCIALSVFTAFAVCSCAGGEKEEMNGGEEEKKEERTFTDGPVYDGVALDKSLWEKPDWFYSADDDRKEEGTNIKGLYYRTWYKGEETYAFAYLGVPEGVGETNKAPAVLLVHGGAGSAYWEWVNEWNKRGFVALAMDLEGHVPTEKGTLGSPWTDLYVKSKYPAPQNHNYDDSNKPMDETWMYYAVQTAILGNSLLRSFGFVDGYKVGVCGVSWGGVIASIITGYDDRFAFSVPIYGAVGLKGTFGNIASYYEKNPEALVWDDDKGIAKSETPKMFICSNADTSFSPDAISALSAKCKNSRVLIMKNLPHSQYHATGIKEAYVFAKDVTEEKSSLITFAVQPAGKKGEAEITVPDGETVEKVSLIYTEGDMSSLETWERVKCSYKDGIIAYEAPDSARNYFIEVESGKGFFASSQLIKIK